MLWLATAAMVAANPARSAREPVVVQATATVHVIRGVRLKLDSPINRDAPPAHHGFVTADRIRRDAHLIEFE